MGRLTRSRPEGHFCEPLLLTLTHSLYSLFPALRSRWFSFSIARFIILSIPSSTLYWSFHAKSFSVAKLSQPL